MRDVDDGDARRGEVADDAEQVLDLLARRARRDGSSMTISRASRDSARAMLTICLPAADSVPTSRCGEISRWPSRASSSRVPAVAAARCEKPRGGELVAEEDVLGDRQPVDEVELLVDRGDAELEGRDRVRRS